EFCGAGLSSLSVPDRATLSNMCPEYGATASLFPVDQQTLRYLETTGRDRQLIDLVERYTREQGMFRSDESATPVFDELLELEPVGEGGRRIAGEACRGTRTACVAHGQDQPGARIPGRDRLPASGGPDALPGGTRLLPGWLRVHDLHRQQRPVGQRGGRSRGR